jgi:D-glycero-alpha-D-manno-heptose-7-phosphate kinase
LEARDYEFAMLIRAKAPLRVSFAGGGTDVSPFPEREGGCVLSATINKHAYGTLRTREDTQINIKSLDFGVTAKYKGLKDLIYDGNLDLVKAAIQKAGPPGEQGFDMFLHCDVPPGSGLGSSSTVMVALVGLLREARSLPLTNYELAHEAYAIERHELGIRGGMQDQYAATFGGFNFIEFNKDQVIVNSLKVNQDYVNELEHNLLLAYIGSPRFSDRIIEDQTIRYEESEEETVIGLRKQKELAVDMKNLLLQGRLHEWGELLHESWEYKKRVSPKISTPYIDELYQLARHEGAVGGKIPGAGGGGYMLLYCEFEQKHKVAEVLSAKGAIITDFGFESNGLQTWRVAND